MVVKISIIIPTKNEEKYLPKLLEDIKKQKIDESYEIIVSDNNSTDKTRIIAKKYNCRVVDGGLPAVARNNGVKAAKGKYVVFFDADVRLVTKNYISPIIKKMEKKNLSCVVPTYIAKSLNPIDLICSEIGSLFMFITSRIYQIGIGANIFCLKKAFEEVGGFNEKYIFFEDGEFINRISKRYKSRVFITKKYFYDMRRVISRGRFKYYLGSLKKIFKTVFLKKKQDYDFDIYNK